MQRLARLTRRCLTALDAIASRVYGWPWNPLHQSGTVAVAMLLALVGTGIYLLLVYRLGAPADSVARIAADPWLGSWIRTSTATPPTSSCSRPRSTPHACSRRGATGALAHSRGCLASSYSSSVSSARGPAM